MDSEALGYNALADCRAEFFDLERYARLADDIHVIVVGDTKLTDILNRYVGCGYEV